MVIVRASAFIVVTALFMRYHISNVMRVFVTRSYVFVICSQLFTYFYYRDMPEMRHKARYRKGVLERFFSCDLGKVNELYWSGLLDDT